MVPRGVSPPLPSSPPPSPTLEMFAGMEGEGEQAEEQEQAGAGKGREEGAAAAGMGASGASGGGTGAGAGAAAPATHAQRQQRGERKAPGLPPLHPTTHHRHTGQLSEQQLQQQLAARLEGPLSPHHHPGPPHQAPHPRLSFERDERHEGWGHGAEGAEGRGPAAERRREVYEAGGSQVSGVFRSGSGVVPKRCRCKNTLWTDSPWACNFMCR